MRGLADRERHVFDELREKQDVRHVRVQRLLEQRGRPAGSNDQDRGAGELANRSELVRRQRGAPRRMEDGVQVTAGERGCASGNVGACAHQLDLGMARERLP